MAPIMVSACDLSKCRGTFFAWNVMQSVQCSCKQSIMIHIHINFLIDNFGMCFDINQASHLPVITGLIVEVLFKLLSIG